MLNKEGQVTIFIIIAVLIVAAMALFFVFRGGLGLGQSSLDPETEKVYLFVEDCVQGNLEEALYWIGQGGGYYLSGNIINSNGVPYYIYNGQFYYPELEDINNEISSYINFNIDYCLGRFEDFPQFNISKGEISSTTEIKDEEVVSKINYPIMVQRGEEKTRIEDFEAKIYSRIKEMHKFAGEIIGNYSAEGLCLSCMYETAETLDFKVDITNNEEGMIITLIDESNSTKTPEFKFAIYNE